MGCTSLSTIIKRLNKSIFKSSVFEDKLECYSLVSGVKTALQRL